MTEHAKEVLRNPLARFKLIARIVHFFRTTNNDQPLDVSGKFSTMLTHQEYASYTLISLGLPVNKIKEESKSAGPPLRADLFAAADAILRIHFTYDLNVTDVRWN